LKSYYNKPPSDFKGTELIRCSVCGSYNRLSRTPRGGTYEANLTASDQTSSAGQDKTIYQSASQGCWFCHSPAWADGGKAGDLIPPFKGKG